MKAYQERLITLLKDTITLLCRNGLEYDQEFCVEGLLGVTLDKNEVFLIPVKELITDKGVGTELALEASEERTEDRTIESDSEIPTLSPGRKERPRKRHRHKESSNAVNTVDQSENVTNFHTSPENWGADVKGNILDPEQLSRDSAANQEEIPHKKARHKEENDQPRFNVKSEINDDDDDDDVVVIKEEIDDHEFASAFQDGSMDSSQNRDGMDFFSQPGTSHGQMAFPMDQLQTSGVMGSGMPPTDSDGSWLQSPGDMQPPGEWQQQKHQESWACDICGTKFTFASAVRRHKLSTHLNVQYPCNLCRRSFTRQYGLTRHYKEKHEENVHSPNEMNEKTLEDVLPFHTS